jgi:hypothetical protein
MATTKTATKPIFGWAYESAKGVLQKDIFSSKENASFYADEYSKFKLVKVQISKYVPKKSK